MLNLQCARVGPLLKGLLAAFAVAAVAFAWLYWAGPYRVVTLDRAALAAAAPDALEDGAGARIATREAWRTRRQAIADAIEAEIYGPLPADVSARVVRRALIAPADVGGVAGVEQIEIEAGDGVHFNLVLVMPPGSAPAPVIVMQNFCGQSGGVSRTPAGDCIASQRLSNPMPKQLLRPASSRGVWRVDAGPAF